MEENICEERKRSDDSDLPPATTGSGGIQSVFPQPLVPVSTQPPAVSIVAISDGTVAPAKGEAKFVYKGITPPSIVRNTYSIITNEDMARWTTIFNITRALEFFLMSPRPMSW